MTSASRPRAALVHRAVLRPWPVSRPRLRIFLFHHAGGSHHLYRDWGPLFPADWEVVLMEAPGRGVSPGRRGCADLGELTDLFAREIQPWTDRPYAFFGHSMGGLVCHELTRRLRSRGQQGPVWLGLSAWTADPRWRGANRGSGRHLLDDDELRAFLRRVGGTPQEILQSRTLWRLFSTAIRHDLQLMDTCDPDVYTPVDDLPHSVFGGTQDTLLPADALMAWALGRPRLTGLHLYAGDHFYLRPHRQKVVRQITAHVLAALPKGVDSSRSVGGGAAR